MILRSYPVFNDALGDAKVPIKVLTKYSLGSVYATTILPSITPG
jgi:hypothetical protein